MQEEILKLIELQKIDLEILRIERDLQKIPESLQKAQKERDQINKKLELLNTNLEEKRGQKKFFEEELQEEYQRLKKTQARLMQIRGTREYQLLLKEIEEIKRNNKQKEDEILKLMEEIENLEKDKDKLEKKLEEIEAIFNEEEQKFNKFCQELLNQKGKLLEKREKLIQKISQNLLKKYEAVRQKKAGIGIAPVINSICEGCHMAIPPQLYNELQRDNKYYECPHCKRLIYYKKIYVLEEEENKSLEHTQSLKR
ncbi:MAG: C4-type zinc ribbon domain-containing protein [Thermodesulfobacteriaceae bacterium]|nr:C4-type zinc ribbon domain-containing protein [Thermodesulfobacteriaceae bacterium]MCX8041935.1 C4-type zinc ribbon domain-containing protein [Thermodesulfobacteriaceae bacterium]MDW8136353.1 C4-type zinc ribbon domain-containing protein [Thermodesulfobacterium sp.]